MEYTTGFHTEYTTGFHAEYTTVSIRNIKQADILPANDKTQKCSRPRFRERMRNI